MWPLHMAPAFPRENIQKVNVPQEPGANCMVFSELVSSHPASLPLHSISCSSGQPRFKVTLAAARSWGMGAIVAEILEKYTHPQDDESTAISTQDSCPCSLKGKCWERNRGPRRELWKNSFIWSTNYCASSPSKSCVIEISSLQITWLSSLPPQWPAWSFSYLFLGSSAQGLCPAFPLPSSAYLCPHILQISA